MSIAIKNLVTRSLPLAAVALGLTLASPASAGNLSTLPQGAALFSGQRLVDDYCYGHLDMQSDGNLVLYFGIGTQISEAAWSSDTWGLEAAPDGYAELTSEGALNVYLYVGTSPAADNASLQWSTNTTSYVPVALNLPTTGDLALSPLPIPNPDYIWASNRYRTGEVVHLPSCPMESSYTMLYPDAYIAGATASVFVETLGGWGECGTQCAAETTCTAWTSSGGHCTLYTGTAEVITNGRIVNPELGVMSGVIVTGS